MKIRVTQLDGKLPNLALMRLSQWHRDRGDEVVFSRHVLPDLFEPEYDTVYGSAIFKFSQGRLSRFQQQWPDAIVGGTGTDSTVSVDDITGVSYQDLDYSPYPYFKPSLGFTQRGCRLKCKFCVVPAKEGKNTSVSSVGEIWRGEGHPKKIHLLDNDFFGQEHWRERISEIRNGGFKVCLNQGINVRLINDEAAEALASIEYRNDSFDRRIVYTAWDNIGHERIFFEGVDKLERAGIPGKHIMAYMLIGYDPSETMVKIFHRFDRMVERDILPYPMVFDQSRRDLKRFQRWVVTGLYRSVAWSDYRPQIKASNQRAAVLKLE
jgi:hypothetical protein